jgi:O-antigen/teichoic acid export membrane protein
MSDNAYQAKPEKSGLRILRNGGWMLGGKTLGAVLSIVYLALITRSLGPERFGEFALIFSFAQAISILVAFQTWQIILQYGTKLVLEKAHHDFAQLILVCLALDLGGFIVGILMTLCGVYFFGDYFEWTGRFQIQIIVFSVIFLLGARGTAIGILRVNDRFRDAALADTLVPITRFFGALFVIITAPSLLGFLIVWALSELMATAIMWVIIWRTISIPLGSQNLREVPTYYRKIPGLAKFALFSNLGSSLRMMSQQVIVLVVGVYAGAAAAGFFRLGHQIGQVLARIADGLSVAIYAEYSRMTHKDGANAAQTMIGRTLRITGISALILLAILALAGKPLIISIFGAAFAPAYPLMLLLGGAAAVQVAASALEPVVLSHGKAGLVLLSNLAGTLLMAISILILMPFYDVTGAAISVVIGTVITAFALGFYYRKVTRAAA